MADSQFTQLDYPVHYFNQPTKYDTNSGLHVPDGAPRPHCEINRAVPSTDPAVLTRNQGRVDCQKCIRLADIRERR